MRRFLACVVAATVLVVLLPAAASAKGGRGSQIAAEHALQKVKDLKQGIGVRTGRELTPALADLAARRNDLDAADRKLAASFLARPIDSNDSDYYGNAYIGSVQNYCPSGSIYCFHWVTNPASADAPDLTDSGGVAGVPDYIESMAAVFDAVHACENGSAVAACSGGLTTGMAWQEPIPDGTTGGGSNKFDVYIKDLFVQGFYGYAATECTTSGPSCPSYMVMDKDYDRFATGTETGLDAMKVTAAHEYNHVLQFGYDVNEDTWMLESTATWAEEKVYPSINDYLQYLPDWVNNTAQPLTVGSTQSNLKIYGSAVWNHWLDHGLGGEQVIQDAWAQSANLPAGYTDSLAPDAYKKSIIDHGGTGFLDQFEDFSVATSEWRAPGNAFPDLYPDVPRVATLTVNGSGVQRTLDHTTFQLLNVAPPGSAQAYTLSATVDAGISSAIALVGRTGTSTTGGSVVSQITRLPNGGSGTVTLPNANLYGRITAVLVNADVDQNGFVAGDWKFTGDNAKFASVKVVNGPSATTSAASSVTMTGATLNGSVNPNGQSTTYQFEYGTDTNYGTAVPGTAGDAGSGTSSVPVSVALTGLTRGTTYHYRLNATNASGTAHGADQTFTTLDPPIVGTGVADPIAATGATLNGTVDPRGRSTTYQFDYGPTTAYGSHVTGAATTTNGAVALAVTGLTQGTTYHFRLSATNADGTTTGSDQTFTTKDPPIVTTDPASAVSGSAATLNGTVNPRGKTTEYWFEYGNDTSYGTDTPHGDPGAGISGVAESASLSGLAPGTTYHYRVVASNSDGTTNGGDQTFTTPGPPIATTGAASAITASSAAVAGTVDPNARATTFRFEYGTTTAYGSQVSGTAGSGASPVSVSGALTALAASTTYHYRLVATNADGTSSGDDATFTTGAAPVSGPSSETPLTPIPAPAQTQAPRPRALGLTLTLVPARLRALLAKGLRVRGGCGETCTVTIKLVISSKDAKKLKLRTTLAQRKAAGGSTLRLRLSKKTARALGSVRLLRAKLVVSAVAPDGRKAALSKPVTFRR